MFRGGGITANPMNSAASDPGVHQVDEGFVAGGLGRGAFVTGSYALQFQRKPPSREQPSPRLAVIDSKSPRLRVNQARLRAARRANV
jgi:hypothetical protein